MDQQDSEEHTLYKVVMNAEEQYSIWPQSRETPAGWRDVGKIGDKKECLTFISMVWTDMRPASLRKRQTAPST